MSDELYTALTIRKRATGGTPLPDETPPPPDCEDDIGPGPVEIVTREEELHEEYVNAPPPIRVIDRLMVTKPSIVVPIEVNAKALWGFLEALRNVTGGGTDYPILSGVKMSFIPGEDGVLLLEATNRTSWAAASLKAEGGQQPFEAVLPLQRAINVIKLLSTSYSTVSIGMDERRIHVGDHSFPFGGKIAHFPKKPELKSPQASLVFNTNYLTEIPERVLPAVDGVDGSRVNLNGVYIDLQKKAAVGSNGNRMHALLLPQMHIEEERSDADLPDGIRIPIEIYRYMAAVEDRDWTGLRICEDRVMVGHEDFGAVAMLSKVHYPDWEKAFPVWPGSWTVSSQEFMDATKEGSLLLNPRGREGMSFRFSTMNELVIVSSESPNGDTFERHIGASYTGKVPGDVTVSLNASYVLDALDACMGDSVRIGIGGELEPVTFQGDGNAFKATIMPIRT